MFPFFHFQIPGLGDYSLSAMRLMVMLSIALSAVVLSIQFWFRGLPVWKALMLLTWTVPAALFGARISHLIVLDSAVKNFSQLVDRFPSYAGMMFYGALFAGMLAFAASTRIYVDGFRDRSEIRDCGVVLAAVTYGFLRIGCLFSGCCWGKLCTQPWSVVYSDPLSSMPYRGVPVHPFQLYEAILGFVIALFLVSFMRRNPSRHSGTILRLFLSLHALACFFSEFYRGDFNQGGRILFGWSINQWISVVIVVEILSRLRWRNKEFRHEFLKRVVHAGGSGKAMVFEGIRHS